MFGQSIHRMKSIAFVGSVIAVAVSGCASQPQLTSDELALRDNAEVFNETVVGGAVAGALLGGLGCMALGNSGSDCLASAAVGGFAGGVAGYLVAAEQQAATEHVEKIDIVTRDIVAENQNIAKVVTSARTVLEENQNSARALRERIASQEAEATEYETMQARIQSNINLLNDVIGRLNEKRDNFAQSATTLQSEGHDTAGLRQQVQEMADQIAVLVEYRGALEAEYSVELLG